ncbi:UNVERIFIED_ORG: hypothetical protein GGE44_002465 [Rhizobium esperanzae]
MTLTFPNKSRSFDESRNAVRFSGYDGMFEVRFLVEANALRTRLAQRSSLLPWIKRNGGAYSHIGSQ